VSSASAQIATNTADISDLKADLEQIVPGLTDEAKQALLACFQHVIWLDHDADYYQRLNDALYASQDVVFISAVFNSGSTVLYPNTSLDDLKAFLTVTATYADSHSSEVVSYALSGSLVVGVNTITVSYQNKTTTFTVTISDYEWGSDYTWLYRPSVDGLLSQNENVSDVVAVGGQALATETLDGDVLNLSAEYNGNNYGSIFKFIPLIPSSASLKAKVKFNALPISSPGGGLRMQVSNGTNGAQLFVYRDVENPDQPRISTFSPNVMRLADITLNKWYILTCELSGDTQIIKVDDVTYNPSALSSYANTETRLIALEPDNTVSSTPGDLDFDIAWIAFKDNSN